ncbi:hypothetical protein [Marinobacter sp. BGYM27]|uniref:hypothetical protein n=1 Tax=unclassified Marinobacter TaxID=83889 RepID=UPI0021A29F0B|nr:hypothetical protein [Marinobacter sp. BGYM27]MDG5500962.1 hypothetical protein [Marinobacter sp. BGYM27]
MTSRSPIGRSSLCKTITAACLLTTFVIAPGAANAISRDQAKRIHERITGVPPTAEKLTEMAGEDAITAALDATENPAFYDVTLKNFAAPWTNEAMSSFVPLNDYTATVIGAVRDNRDFRSILFGDYLYTGGSGLGLPAYSNTNNAHYEQLEESGVSLKDNLQYVTQSAVNGLPPEATAGIMTSRAASQAYFSGGTNRAMFRFTLLNHLCNDLEQVNDVTRPTDRIRQDISRSPGGDSRVFLNSCVGCHSGMDPMAQAFAYYDFEYDADADPDGNLGRLVYNTVGTVDPETGTRVQGKYLINSANFEHGYITPDDHWDNYWRQGPNARLGWSSNGPDGSGSGAKSLGEELAKSEAFAECQVKKVFRNVCFREPNQSQITTLVGGFKTSNFSLRQVFAESAVQCMGD